METITIGKTNVNDIVINDVSVSDLHAEIVEDSGSYYLTDLGSEYGSFINGHRISKRTKLEIGDSILIGGKKLPWNSFSDFEISSKSLSATVLKSTSESGSRTAESALKVIGQITLMFGAVISIVLFLVGVDLIEEMNETTGIVIILSIIPTILVSVLVWAVLRVLSNMSNNVKAINKKLSSR